MMNAYTALGSQEMQKPFDEIYGAGILDPAGMIGRRKMESKAEEMVMRESRRLGVISPREYTEMTGKSNARGPMSTDDLFQLSLRKRKPAAR